MRSGNGIDIPGRHDDAIDSVAHDIARLARNHLWQTASGRFVGDLGTAFQLRREYMDRRLVQIFFDVTCKPDEANVVAPERSSNAASPARGLSQAARARHSSNLIDARLEQMMNSFAFDQRAGKNRPKKRRTRPWLEALDVDPARKVKKFFLCETTLAKSVGGFFRKHEQESGQIVLFNRTFGTEHELVFPAAERSALLGGARLSPRGDTLGKIPVPGGNFYNRRNSHTLRNAQGFQTIARPAVK